MGSKNKTTATTTQQPWSPAQGNLKDALGAAQGLYDGGGFEYTPYQGNRVATFSAPTQAAMANMSQASPVTAQAQAAYGDVMGQTFDDMRQTVTDDTLAALGTRFAGDMGNSLVRQSFARGLGSALAGAENGFRQTQLQGISMAPTIQGMGFADNAQMLQAGGLQDQRNQAVINSNIQQDMEAQTGKKNALIEYSNLVRGIGGMGGSASTSQPGQNPIAGLAAGGLNGLGTYGMMMANPATAPLAIPAGIFAGLGSVFR